MVWRSSSQDWRDRGCVHGNAPLPPKVVTTGAWRRSASCRSFFDASARTTPPPAMIAGALRAREQVGGDGRQFGARGQLLREGVAAGHHRDRRLRQEDVLRDLHPHRAVRDGQRRRPGLRDRGRDLRLGADRVDGLHHAAEGRGLVGEFVQVAVASAAQAGRRDLAADRQYGGGGRPCLLEGGQGGEGPRAGRQEQRSGLTGDAAVRVGRETGVVLHPQADVAQIRSAQGVEHAEGVLAGQAEDGGRAERGQGLHDQVSAVAAGGRVQRGLRLGGGRTEYQVVVVGHCAAFSWAIWRDMIVVSSYAVWEAATDVISAWS